MQRFRIAPGRRLLALATSLAVSALLLPAAPAAAHHECENVPNCVSVNSGTITLSRSGSHSMYLDCPSNAKVAWITSWDKSSSAVDVTANINMAGNAALFTATNWSPTHRNTVVFYLGCSSSPW